MTKHILIAAAIFLTAGTGNLQAQKAKQGKTAGAKSDVKFLDDIAVQAMPASQNNADPKAVFATPVFTSKKSISTTPPQVPVSAPEATEAAGNLQFKYALLLDTEVEGITNTGLFREIDEWYGTRYRLGGNNKDGVDCSALMQALYTTVFGLSIPRTAAEQYNFSSKISRTELREGDLVFFNTIGGVSHVGMYLQNNKFVHASSSGGVTISDLYEDYWMRRFVGVGRIEAPAATTSLLQSKP